MVPVALGACQLAVEFDRSRLSDAEISDAIDAAVPLEASAPLDDGAGATMDAARDSGTTDADADVRDATDAIDAMDATDGTDGF
jgi:hypothetical protein